MASNRKLHRLLRRELEARGVVIKDGKKHPKAIFPNGEQMTLLNSASDHRSFQNQLSIARRLLNDRDFMR